MSEQTQIQPKRTDESVQESVQTPEQVVVAHGEETIFDDEIFIDDLIEEARDVAKNFKQKGGQ